MKSSLRQRNPNRYFTTSVDGANPVEMNQYHSTQEKKTSSLSAGVKVYMTTLKDCIDEFENKMSEKDDKISELNQEMVMQSFVEEARRESITGDNTKRKLAEANEKTR